MSNHGRQVRLLYKVILKLNRGLPPALSELGNTYVKEEFKKHKNCDADQAKIFMTEWTCYAVDLSNQLGVKGIKEGLKGLGKSLTEDELNKFNDDQILQLHELLYAAKSKDVE
ncbi:succinate dehydrogenase assembly factor 3, mitochondrial [Coccinella septempunctata]|uniref:succinate dehydrogenase assembly factor 3, mitochondrial n=1 Tax=Coccinella septempunctata TaxID=41139 RepID=UPI001D05D470|nr:succinate dehydrogenase assembly factor 3, mitochondrial [Coccinella septempunctata]